MSTIIHLEPEQFLQTLYQNHSKMKFHVYPLECGVAAIIYMFDGNDGNTYYLDRPFGVNPARLPLNSYSVHSDMYRKVALYH